MTRTLGLKGMDISQHQGSAVLSDTDGLSFVILRATIGTVVDSDFETFYSKARAAGLVVMAYHYGYPKSTISIQAQVDRFLGIASKADFLWLDQEQSGFDDAQAQDFIDRVHAAGRQIGLYHSASGFGGVTADAKWVADYRSASVSAGYPMKGDASGELNGWDLWQWTSTGTRPGYTGSVDLDWMNPASPLASLLRTGYTSKAQADAQIADLKAQVTELTATITAKNAELAAKDATIAQITQDKIALSAALDAAPGIERERIAQARGQAEAEAIRNA